MPEEIILPLVEFKHIKKTFNQGSVNESLLFEDFNFSVERGQFISVVGSNGSGKTTLLNLICGSLMPDGGTISLGGYDITRMPEYKRSAHIGRVFQDPSIGACPSLTILENMALADNKGKSYNLTRGVSKKRIDYYKQQLELLHLGLEDKINMPVGLLSGGQRQALALLISTLTPIELLILDEHTAALDPKSSENVMELTDKFVREKKLTAIMVTHNLRYAVEYGDRLVMMHKGIAVKDVAYHEKDACTVDDLLKVFNTISIECGN
ncbi:MAG: ABC transporter ATP-binding protein [Firmicutes bacterium HGW-Firmicutes-16]|nr:MAG: ABC transporter ATP-binding protein [Firmicutes bacterium HGW-Firmicutes-16]